MRSVPAGVALPRRTRVYQNHHFDSTRWDYFERRPDDVVIATSYKAGTTWTQSIVAHLIFPDGEVPGPVCEISPWLDMRVVPLEVVLNALKQQSHRRFGDDQPHPVGDQRSDAAAGLREDEGGE